MLQDLNQSNKRDEILLLARSQHKHLLQYGLLLLQQLVLVTFGDKEPEQMDCLIWNGSDRGPSRGKLRKAVAAKNPALDLLLQLSV